MSIINSIVTKDLQVLKVDRPLSGRCADELEQKFADARSFGVKTVVIDLSGVAYIDSRGLAALVAGYKMFDSDIRHFRLAAPQDQARLLFELTMFDRIFQIFDTVTDAVGMSTAEPRRVWGSVPAFAFPPAA